MVVNVCAMKITETCLGWWRWVAGGWWWLDQMEIKPSPFSTIFELKTPNQVHNLHQDSAKASKDKWQQFV